MEIDIYLLVGWGSTKMLLFNKYVPEMSGFFISCHCIFILIFNWDTFICDTSTRNWPFTGQVVGGTIWMAATWMHHFWWWNVKCTPAWEYVFMEGTCTVVQPIIQEVMVLPTRWQRQNPGKFCVWFFVKIIRQYFFPYVINLFKLLFLHLPMIQILIAWVTATIVPKSCLARPRDRSVQ